MMRNIRFTVEDEVFEALQAEAAEKGRTLAAHLRVLVTVRHKKKFPETRG